MAVAEAIEALLQQQIVTNHDFTQQREDRDESRFCPVMAADLDGPAMAADGDASPATTTDGDAISHNTATSDRDFVYCHNGANSVCGASDLEQGS